MQRKRREIHAKLAWQFSLRTSATLRLRVKNTLLKQSLREALPVAAQPWSRVHRHQDARVA